MHAMLRRSCLVIAGCVKYSGVVPIRSVAMAAPPSSSLLGGVPFLEFMTGYLIHQLFPCPLVGRIWDCVSNLLAIFLLEPVYLSIEAVSIGDRCMRFNNIPHKVEYAAFISG